MPGTLAPLMSGFHQVETSTLNFSLRLSASHVQYNL